MFQSTHPTWGATGQSARSSASASVSIHAPHVGCDGVHHCLVRRYPVSIHAPHVGCDFSFYLFVRSSLVSIHAPHVGCDKLPVPYFASSSEFQSTHPTWGATSSGTVLRRRRCFNPRTPRGVRRLSFYIFIITLLHFFSAKEHKCTLIISLDMS